MATFDHTRLAQCMSSDLLDSPRGRIVFTNVVMDYTDYLRTEPQDRECWQQEPEDQAAATFLELVNNDAGWPLARQAVPEFQMSSNADFTHFREPFRHIMHVVRGRMLQEMPPFSQAQRFEEDLLWQKHRHRIEYLGYLAGREGLTAPDRIDEVAQATALMASIGKTLRARAVQEQENDDEIETPAVSGSTIAADIKGQYSRHEEQKLSEAGGDRDENEDEDEDVVVTPQARRWGKQDKKASLGKNKQPKTSK